LITSPSLAFRFPPCPPLATSRRPGLSKNKTCFVVSDSNGQKLAYVYFEDEPGRQAAKLLSKDEARRIAVNIVKLPELAGK